MARVTIPENYRLLRYIENGVPGSYFDTGFIPDNVSRMEIGGCAIEGDTALAGSRTAVGTSDRFTVQYISTNCYRCSFGTVDISAPTSYAKGTAYNFSLDQESFSIDGVLIGKPSSRLYGVYPVYMLGAMNSGNVPTNFGRTRITHLVLYRGDVLEHNFIPCLNDEGIPGFYDHVSETFISPLGDGTLLYEEEPVKGIRIRHLPSRTVYELGEDLDDTGLAVDLLYECGYKSSVRHFELSGYDPASPGVQTVTVTFGEYSTSFKVTVKAPEEYAIGLEEMKEYLRVDFHDEDALIRQMLRSAEQLCMDVMRTEKIADLAAAENGKAAVMYATAYLYEHREEADHHALILTLRALLFGARKEGF